MKSQSGSLVVGLLLLMGLIPVGLLGAQFAVGMAEESVANTEVSTVRLAIVAYQVENGGELPVTLSGELDKDKVGSYVVGDIKGNYKLGNEGLIIGASGWGDRVEWADGKWVRK